MTYDPAQVRFSKLSGSAMLGWTFRLGESRLGQTEDTRTSIDLSSISLTDGYTTGDNGELSIDPLTGTAGFTERFRPGVSDTVASHVDPPIKPGEHFAIEYGPVTVTQGTVLKVQTSMSAEGFYWVRKTTYTLVGIAGTMLANTADWDGLDEEDALTRLRRFFTVNTDLLTSEQIDYLDSILMPAKGVSEGTPYLEIAREFSNATKFPVRPVSTFPSRWNRLDVIPSVTFDGETPDPVVIDAEEWSGAAEFELDESGINKPVSLEVKRDYTGFLGGFNTVPTPGTPLGQFQLGTTRLGTSYSVPVGFQTPSVIDVFGTPLVVSKIQHDFTTQSYRSQLEVIAPAEVTTGV